MECNHKEPGIDTNLDDRLRGIFFSGSAGAIGAHTQVGSSCTWDHDGHVPEDDPGGHNQALIMT